MGSWLICGGHLQRGLASLVLCAVVSHRCRFLSGHYLKRCKMLRPEKWNLGFGTDRKFTGFRKALKFIVMVGMDASIRAEVWEFLLGCYALSSTT